MTPPDPTAHTAAETAGGLLFTNARLVTPDREIAPGWLATRGPRIAALGHGPSPPDQSGRVIDCRGRRLLPGFIDLHAHGALGVDVMDADPDGLRQVARFYASHGVTGWTPTTWTGSPQATRAAVEAIAAASGAVPGGATILGVHLEGPWLNPRRCGAQDTTHIRPADRAEALGLLDTGAVRQVTLAPEIDANRWLIAEATGRGVAVSIGHSDATYEQARQAVAAGARLVTHTYNAMRPLGHREPGLTGAALTLDELRCELIADNVHVHPAAIDLLVRAKRGPRGVGVNLVTDALRAAGMPDSRTVDLGGREGVMDGGVVRLTDGTIAGSVLTMDRAVANLHAATGLEGPALAEAASLGPATAIGLAETKGSLAAGKDADLVLLDRDWHAVLTVVAGTVVHDRDHLAADGHPTLRPEHVRAPPT